jgi:hypothetical protein
MLLSKPFSPENIKQKKHPVVHDGDDNDQAEEAMAFVIGLSASSNCAF